MPSEIKSTQAMFLRHLCVASLGALLVYSIYLSYGAWGVERALWPDWGQDHPYWRAWGHAAFILLFLALVLGPAARLSRPLARFLPWRRELGIWFVLFAAGHAYAIWDRWARGDIAGLFGGVYVEDLGAYVLARPEVGIMNMMMVVVAPMAILLAVTSFDRAVKFLGRSSWKWLHTFLVNAIFYILMLRGILYFFFFFQAAPPEWRLYPDIWFLYVFLGMGLVVVSLQAAAFAKSVLEHRNRRGQKNGVPQVAAVIGIAALFVMPLGLMTGTVAYFDSRGVKEHITRTQPTQSYAQTFYMVIHDANQDIHLWVKDLDTEPYFRQTVETAGAPIFHLIYRYRERTLYTAERDADTEIVWSRVENVTPEEMELSSIAAGPGVWAAQYGAGEHQIPWAGTVVHVTIHSVQEAIADEVFAVPDDV
jgi:DMSO/TMAO reductase YedYZ heme-binding membrane subunit